MATKKKNGRKGPRSAKQKAATRKLVAFNKRKTTPKRRKAAPKRKVNKPRKRRATVVKKRSTPKKKGLGSSIPLINNPMFKKAAVGVGTATLGAAALGLVLPSFANNPIVKPVLALVAGGPIGAVAQVLTQGGISGLGLGGGGNTSGAVQSTGGFA